VAVMHVIAGRSSDRWGEHHLVPMVRASPIIALQQPVPRNLQLSAALGIGGEGHDPRPVSVCGCESQNPGSLNGAARTLREPEAEDGGRNDDDRCSKQAGIDEGFDGQCNGTAGCCGGVK
jgi:hypothetical protein